MLRARDMSSKKADAGAAWLYIVPTSLVLLSGVATGATTLCGRYCSYLLTDVTRSESVVPKVSEACSGRKEV